MRKTGDIVTKYSPSIYLNGETVKAKETFQP